LPEFVLYGYSIYSNLEYRLSSRALININNGRIKRLGKTKSRLFEYLLSKADGDYIYDNDIIIDVFEDYGLRCSKSYLLSIIKDIRAAFLSVGFDRNPIIRTGRNAYVINSGVIQKIYAESHSVRPQQTLQD
jgi:DNA-binding winged helix-turn-helix (wHTH) protein